MKKYLILIAAFGLLTFSCTREGKVYTAYEDYPAYAGTDLGLSYSPEKSTFKLWSPVAKSVTLHLYRSGDGDDKTESIPLVAGENGTWEVAVERDLNGIFYTFQVETDKALKETPGIYAKAVGVNGKRAAVVPMMETNPQDWEKDQRPALRSVSDAIIYEMHVRDFTIHPSSGSNYPGRYLGLTETGTKNPFSQSTGIDHLKEMGITHVHLLPVFDFRSVNEAKLDSPQYNWGYDPQNYNVPDGSYSTNPFEPVVRIREFKQMVMALHAAGIRVVMDVVYNHTGETENSNFNLEVPGYYYRHTADGKWSDAAACGNETASERAMMRKYIIESCEYWVKEYHIDGFRFDLMGIHDIETMNQLTDRLLKIEPSLIFYGEGWTAGSSPLPDSLRALKANTARLKRFAAFSDELRDGLKGSVFDESALGLVNGGEGADASIRFGMAAATFNSTVEYGAVNYSKAPWAREPWQCINYVSCHDNNTLADKLRISGRGRFSQEELERMDVLANAIVLTSQGVPFLHAGEEMMRTKRQVENSFNRPDSINAIDWNWKQQHSTVVDKYKEMISLRKAHPAFRLPTASMVQRNVGFPHCDFGSMLYMIQKRHDDGSSWEDSWTRVMVVINRLNRENRITFPPGNWKVGFTTGRAKPGVKNQHINAEPSSLTVLYVN